MEFLNEKTTPILMIIMGLIALAFPTVPLTTVGILFAVIVFILALILFIKGSIGLSDNKILGASAIILGIICVLLCYELLTNSSFVSDLLSLLIYLFGLVVIIYGFFTLISGRYYVPFSLVGLSTIIFGIITIIVGVFLNNPQILGAVIGVWLVIAGVLYLFTDNNKNFINV